MHIALDARYLQYPDSGIARYIRSLAQWCTSQGDTVTLLGTDTNAHPLLWEQWLLPKLLRRAQPDVYHAPASLGVPLLGSIPTVLTVQDIIPLELSDFFSHSRWPRLSRQLYRWRIQTALGRATEVLYTSVATRDALHRHGLLQGFGATLHHIPLGVSEAFFHRQSLLDELVGSQYLLHHGGMAERKNSDLALRILAELRTHQSRDISLVITGSYPSEERRIRARARELGIEQSVKCIGSLTEAALVGVVQHAAAVLYLSRAEGFGLPILEGLAAGVPVVASDLAVHRELGGTVPWYLSVEHPPYSEQVVQLGAALVQRAMTQMSESRRKRGQVRARDYSWQTCLARTYERYQAIAESD